MNNFEEILIKRRSIRKYTKKKVSNEILVKIIEDAACAPSSGNEQPWKFIIVNNKSLIEKISDDAKTSILSRISKNPNDCAKKYEKMLKKESFNIFYNAPALVFIIGDKSLKNTIINCTLAASYFMMSAVTRGLGTCWINFATAITSQELLNTLGISKEYIIVAPIIIGYPDETPDMPKRKKLEIVKID
ncbi:MAG: nitroreductase [Bacteroidales bacterium]|jgi:nitroreductase|nr:nitroreductase [Bacteroidales bacterium]